jgi:hypothetical protein
MKMILWGHEHQQRATNLAHAVKENAADIAPLVAAPATIPVSADTTLTIWGHGGPDSFAELTAQALATFIRAWKTKNRTLNTVELVTCDARHSDDPNNRDSFTDKLLPLLIANSKVLVKVMTLPRGLSSTTRSELWATELAGYTGYYFIAADNDAALASAVSIFDSAWAAVPPGTTPDKQYDAMFAIAKPVLARAAQRGAVPYNTALGALSGLRQFLVAVTVYNVSGKTIDVPKTIG